MNCREFIDFLRAYLDGELAADERATFERHIEACPPCVDYLETYKETVELETRCAGDDPVEPVPEELVQAILAARRGRGSDGGGA